MSLQPRNATAVGGELQVAIENAEKATGGATNLFLVMAWNPDLLRRYLPFGEKILHGRLPGWLRELVILRTAAQTGCRYEDHHHRRMGLAQGHSGDEIDAAVDCSSVGLSGVAGLMLQSVDEIIENYQIADTTWSLLRSQFDDSQLVEIPLLIGHYVMLAGLINTTDIPIEQ
jgi:alkylhydroperoxidase family enzyme